MPWQPVAEIIGSAPVVSPAGFIFHVGHCGSTLLSRLLEFANGTQSLREPLPLRALAQDLADAGDWRSFLCQPELLERPADSLSAVLAHLRITAQAETITKAVNSPVLQTYSKAPEHSYNAGTRAAILADSRLRFATEITASRKWVEELADRSKLVATATSRFT